MPSGEVDDRATKLLSAGNKAFKEGRFAEAESAYRAAFELKKGYDIAGNLGAAELAQGKLREAAQHLAFTLRMFPITGEPALRDQMQKAFDQCRQSVASIRVKLVVSGTPAASEPAQIVVDGVAQGEAPLADDVYVEPGAHIVEAKLSGFAGAPRTVNATKGNSVEVVLTLSAIPQRDAAPVVAKRRSLIPGLALASLAVVGLGGGVGFLAMSLGSHSSADTRRASIAAGNRSCVAGAGNYDAVHCNDLQNDVAKYVTYHNVAIGAFAAGGAAAIGTLAYFLWPSKTPLSTARALHVTPILGANDGGLLVSGSF